jgi:hypothetical protein
MTRRCRATDARWTFCFVEAAPPKHRSRRSGRGTAVFRGWSPATTTSHPAEIRRVGSEAGTVRVRLTVCPHGYGRTRQRGWQVLRSWGLGAERGARRSACVAHGCDKSAASQPNWLLTGGRVTSLGTAVVQPGVRVGGRGSPAAVQAVPGFGVPARVPDHAGRTAGQRDRCLVRQVRGELPWARLNARLNASSASYPTRWAMPATPRSVVAKRSRARCIRQSVR